MSYKSEPMVKTETLNLERVRLTGRVYFGTQELELLELTQREDKIRDALTIEWSIMCRGEMLRNESKEVTFEYPINWWEHFKYAKFPRWLLKKFPAKWHRHTQVVTFKELAVYPKLSEVLKISSNKINYVIHTQVEPYWIKPIDMTKDPK